MTADIRGCCRYDPKRLPEIDGTRPKNHCMRTTWLPISLVLIVISTCLYGKENESAVASSEHKASLVYVTPGDQENADPKSGAVFAINNENTLFSVQADFEDAKIAANLRGIKAASSFFKASPGPWGSVTESSTGQHLASTETLVSDATKAKQIASQLGFPLTLRERTQCELKVTFSPKQDSFALGESPVVTANVVNIGKVAAFLEVLFEMPSDDSQASETFGFLPISIGWKPNSAQVRNDTHGGGGVRIIELRAGETGKIDIDLGRRFRFENPGEYAFIGVIRTKLLRSGDYELAKRRAYQWTDCLGSEFVVRFRE